MIKNAEPFITYIHHITANPIKLVPELTVLVIGALLSYLLVWKLRASFQAASTSTKGHFKSALYALLGSRLSPLLGYGLMLLCILLGEYIFKFLDYKITGLNLAFQIIVSIIVGKAISLISRKPRLGLLVGVSVAFFSILDQINPLNGVFQFLDSFGFVMGGTRFSIFSISKDLLKIFFVIWVSVKISASIQESIKSAKKIRVSSKELIMKLSDIALYTIAFLIVLKILGINITALAVVGGGISVGIGFGLQKISSNFISGMILVYEKSIEIGDLLELDATMIGWVRKLGARYTLIETFDGREVMVPNEDFMTNRVTSWTFSNNSARIEVMVPVAYGTNLDTVIEILMAAAKSHPEVMEDPAPGCYLREFGDSSVKFQLYFFIKDIHYGRIQAQSDVMMAIWKGFEKNGIIIPFPQQDVHLKELPAVKSSKK